VPGYSRGMPTAGCSSGMAATAPCDSSSGMAAAGRGERGHRCYSGSEQLFRIPVLVPCGDDSQDDNGYDPQQGKHSRQEALVGGYI
jgi:hypothetical protein